MSNQDILKDFFDAGMEVLAFLETASKEDIQRELDEYDERMQRKMETQWSFAKLWTFQGEPKNGSAITDSDGYIDAA